MFNDFINWVENFFSNASPQTMIFICLGVAVVTLLLLILSLFSGSKKKKKNEEKVEEVPKVEVPSKELSYKEAPIPVEDDVVNELMNKPFEPQVEKETPTLDSPTITLDDVVAEVNKAEITDIEAVIEPTEEVKEELEESKEEVKVDEPELSFNYDDNPEENSFEEPEEEINKDQSLPPIFSSVYLEPRQREEVMEETVPPKVEEPKVEEPDIVPVIPSWPVSEPEPIINFNSSSGKEPETKSSIDLVDEFKPEVEVKPEPISKPVEGALTADLIREKLMQLKNAKEEVKPAEEEDELEDILKHVGLGIEEAKVDNEYESSFNR